MVMTLPDLTPLDTEAPLRARELYRFFRAGEEETLALQGVSLELSRGELVAVIGPSGSGKSTLLNLLAGLDEPSGGTVWLGGLRMSHQPETVKAQLRSRQLGVLRQADNLLPHLSVRANLTILASIRGVDGHEDELLESLGIAGQATSLPHQLSGGELARAGLAVAMVGSPPVLLADEPTGELDGDTEDVVLELLRHQATQGVAVLVASHSPAVHHLADRVVELLDGRVRR
ncbi:MAG: ATP-binding cassette domain-containing protein [Nocardioidaceae bacterium]